MNRIALATLALVALAAPVGAQTADAPKVLNAGGSEPVAETSATAPAITWPVVKGVELHRGKTTEIVHIAPGISAPTVEATAPAAAIEDTSKPAEAPAAVETPPPPPPPTLLVDIDLSTQRMRVTEDGTLKYTWPVSSARQGYRTPTGNFTPTWMAKMWYSRQYDMSPMPHSVFFSGGVAVHATYATGMLGIPASHGCVRLAPKNAATFYGLVSKHGKAQTRIAVHGKPRYSNPAMASNRRNQQRYMIASNGYAYSNSFSFFGTPQAYYVKPPRYAQQPRAYYVPQQNMKKRNLQARRQISTYSGNY